MFFNWELNQNRDFFIPGVWNCELPWHNTPLSNTSVDMWAAGCVLGEMLLHQPLFAGKERCGRCGRCLPYQTHHVQFEFWKCFEMYWQPNSGAKQEEMFFWPISIHDNSIPTETGHDSAQLSASDAASFQICCFAFLLQPSWFLSVWREDQQKRHTLKPLFFFIFARFTVNVCILFFPRSHERIFYEEVDHSICFVQDGIDQLFKIMEATVTFFGFCWHVLLNEMSRNLDGISSNILSGNLDGTYSDMLYGNFPDICSGILWSNIVSGSSLTYSYSYTNLIYICAFYLA